MGLSHPVACKVQEKHGNPQCRVATCSMQGYRLSMEDAHSVYLDLDNHPHTAFLGVFDGHGGAMASKFCSETVHKRCSASSTLVEKDLKQIVLNTDEEFLKPDNEFRTHGSTCVFVLIDFDPSGTVEETKSVSIDSSGPGPKYAVTISNTGDSRCVWGTLRDEASSKYFQCTEDHKPTNIEEKNRIFKANGVVSNGRVDGDLSVSRAIGDWQFKADASLPLFAQKVSPEPDVTTIVARPGDWLLIACDGIFERLSTEQVAKFVNETLRENQDPVATARALCEYSLQSGSKDNMTTIIVYFKDGVDWAKEEPAAGKPFFVDGPLHPEDASFMNAYRRFAIDNGFGDRVPNIPVQENNLPAAAPPILSLIAELARANNVEISTTGNFDGDLEEGGVISLSPPTDKDDQIQDTDQ